MNLEQEMTPSQMAEEIIRLRSAAAKRGKLTLKVSTKGAVSLYGMGRFPVTLYRSQWEQVLGHTDTIRAYLAANSSSLAVKE